MLEFSTSSILMTNDYAQCFRMCVHVAYTLYIGYTPYIGYMALVWNFNMFPCSENIILPNDQQVVLYFMEYIFTEIALVMNEQKSFK